MRSWVAPIYSWSRPYVSTLKDHISPVHIQSLARRQYWFEGHCYLQASSGHVFQWPASIL